MCSIESNDNSIVSIVDRIEPNLVISVESELESKAESELELKIDINLDSISQNKVEMRCEANLENNIESNVELNGDSIASESEPKIETKVEPKDESNVEPLKSELTVELKSKYIRKTSTEMLAKIWRIIGSIEWQKSAEELHQLMSKEMFNLFSIKYNEKELKKSIESAIEDKLIIAEESDDQRMRYVANFDPKLFGQLSNDWFCFGCHIVRENVDLIGCQTCFRAFHLQCLKVDKKSMKELDENSFKCNSCRLDSETDSSKISQISKEELNKCFSLVLKNLEFSFDSQIFDKFSVNLTDKSKVLVFKEMDLISIKQKVMNGMYDKWQQLVNDFKHFGHNFLICVESDFTSSLKEMADFERRFTHEISELRLCVDCYKYSSDISYDIPGQPHDWFCQVCEEPHELVFAKFGKYPYWPAKVINRKAGGQEYDVRFFDPPEFSRAVIPIKNLRPIKGYTPSNELDLPMELLKEHLLKMRAKGAQFVQTVKEPPKSATKRRSNADPKGTPKLMKKSAEDESPK